ncbi:MAG: tetratricopeptide repeat protein [Proteobacteria bacterium]|nr:tetratricopeptide repeat protein [Pseudomonadota bacterium]
MSAARSPRRVAGGRASGPYAGLCLVSVLCLGAAAGANAQDKTAPTVGDISTRQVEVHRDTPAAASTQRAMENYRRFLELQKTDPKLRAEAMRRLGDLNLDAGELQRLEQEVSVEDLQAAEAIRLYTTLLKVYPDYRRNDQVLYQLARAYETTAQPAPALATYDRIVQQYPGTAQIAEVQFRRGELLFSAKRYAEAQGAYAAVVSHGRTSGYYLQSLYKQGWSLFKQSQTLESLQPFGRVLDAKLGDSAATAVPLTSLRRGDRELVEDTLGTMSIAFSYNEGAGSLEQYLRQLGARPWEWLLYARLGDLYVEKKRYQDAAAAYRAYVARDPYSDHAPELDMAAIEAYGKGGFSDLVLDGKHEFVEHYNLDSPYWKTRKRAEHPQVLQALKTNLKDVATYFHANAQKSGRVADYQEAARWYRGYLKSFPDDPDSAATNYLLAEVLYASHQYGDAAAEYARTAYDYPKNDKSAAAAYAGLVSYQKGEADLDGAQKAAWHLRATDAGMKFARTFPEHPDSAGVLTRAAEDLFAAGDHSRAVTAAQLLLARQPPVDMAKQRIGWTIIAQTDFDAGDYAQAEPAFQHARDLAGTDDKMRADLTERLAASVYKQGEARQKAGDAAGAVDDFLRVTRVAPDSKIRANAEYDAAATLITLKQWDRAIPALEDFRRSFPQHALQPEVTRKLAVAYSAANRPGEAAAEFERIAANPAEDHAVQREALLQSADLYAKAGDTVHAAGMLEKFVAANPAPLADAQEARARLADYADKAGDTARRDRWYGEIVRADGDAGGAASARSHYLAARAQLALAQPARDAFRAVRLTAPLKKSLVAKRAALEKAMDGYRRAADYNVAEVTTAATFEMAELYRTLSKDLLASERPAKLHGTELEEYNSLLEEQVFPFEEQAIKMHELNTARTRDGVFDEWVQKSFQALAELKPARYGKSELQLQSVSGPDAAVVNAALVQRRAGQLEQAEKALKAITGAPAVAAPAQTPTPSPAAAPAAAAPPAPATPGPGALAWTELGVTQRLRGEFKDAAQSYEQAIALDAQYAPAWRDAGVLHDLYLQDPNRALAAFEEYRKITGEDKPVSGWIAELRQRLGMPPVRRTTDSTAPAGDAAAPATAPASAAPAAGESPAGGPAPAPAPAPAPTNAPAAAPANAPEAGKPAPGGT